MKINSTKKGTPTPIDIYQYENIGRKLVSVYEQQNNIDTFLCLGFELCNVICNTPFNILELKEKYPTMTHYAFEDLAQANPDYESLIGTVISTITVI